MQCCSAVCLLVSHSIVHRDIAARNFLVTESLKILLSDFGLSKQIEKEDGIYIWLFCCFCVCCLLFVVSLLVFPSIVHRDIASEKFLVTV
jgi:serine/threonine protein kinase